MSKELEELREEIKLCETRNYISRAFKKENNYDKMHPATRLGVYHSVDEAFRLNSKYSA